MKDGRRFTEKAAKPYGRLPGHPLPAEKLEAKFLDCARRVLTPSAAENVLALVRQIDRVSMRAILDAMTARPTVATK